MNTISLKWHGLKWACMLLLCLICWPNHSFSEKLNLSTKDDKTVRNHVGSNSDEQLISTSNSVVNLDIDSRIENYDTGIPDDPDNPDTPLDGGVGLLIVASMGYGFIRKAKNNKN